MILRLKKRIVGIAASRGVTLTAQEVRGFLLQMVEEEAFDDIELDPIALTAIAGGQAGSRVVAAVDDNIQRLQSSPRFNST